MKTLTILLTLLVAIAGAQQKKYITFTLGPNQYQQVTLSTINDSGQVLGWWPTNGEAYVISPGNVWTKNIIKTTGSPLTMNNAATIIGIEAPSNKPFIKKWEQPRSSSSAPFVSEEIYYSINTAGVIAGIDLNYPQRGLMALDVGGGPIPFPHGKNEEVTIQLSQTSLNNLNQVVGYWFISPASYSGFFYDSNSKELNTTFNMPGAVSSFPFAINDNQEVVGSWTDQNGVSHGFYWNSTTGFSNIDVTGDTEMQLVGINNQSVILGAWRDANTPPKYHVVTIVNGQPTASINVPKSKYTLGFAINNVGQVVGEYETQAGVWRGFIYTPQHQEIAKHESDPGTWAARKDIYSASGPLLSQNRHYAQNPSMSAMVGYVTNPPSCLLSTWASPSWVFR